MKRRKFLTIAGAGAAIVALPTVGFSSPAFFKHAIASIINRDLNYLKLDQQGVEQFAEAFSADIHHSSFGYIQKMKAKVGSEYLLPGSSERSEILDYVVSNYLLATDFFVNKMDETKVVKYVGLYDSYKRPCSNPFSHLYYPQVDKPALQLTLNQ